MSLELYKLPASNWPAFFGTPDNRIERDATIIGQTENCDAFLVLSRTACPELIPQAGIDPAFTFTYCQEWGFTINDDVLRRVKKDLREKAISKLTVQVSTGKVFDASRTALSNMTQAHVIGMANGITGTDWTLADNSRVYVTIAELTEAMTLAGLAQSAIWGI